MRESPGLFWRRFTRLPALTTWICQVRLHPLKGEMKGFWAVTVRANWRVVLRFDDGGEDVDYVDYH